MCGACIGGRDERALDAPLFMLVLCCECVWRLIKLHTQAWRVDLEVVCLLSRCRRFFDARRQHKKRGASAREDSKNKLQMRRERKKQ